MNSSNQNPRNLVEIKLKFWQPNTKPKAQSMNELRRHLLFVYYMPPKCILKVYKKCGTERIVSEYVNLWDRKNSEFRQAACTVENNSN